MKFFLAMIIAICGLLVAGHFLAQEDASKRSADSAAPLPEAITVAATTNAPDSAPTTANLETALAPSPAEKPAPAPVPVEAPAPSMPVIYPPVADKIDTPDQHHYENCKLVRVDPDGVVVSHRLGTAKLLFITMPADFQKAYGYDPEAAQKATADQEARNAASDAMVTQQKSADEQAQQQAAAAPVPTAVPGAPAPAAASKLTPGERDFITHQIAALQDDIVSMQRDQAKLSADRREVLFDHNGVSLGSYHDKIAQEEGQIAELKARLQQ